MPRISIRQGTKIFHLFGWTFIGIPPRKRKSKLNRKSHTTLRKKNIPYIPMTEQEYDEFNKRIGAEFDKVNKFDPTEVGQSVILKEE